MLNLKVYCVTDAEIDAKPSSAMDSISLLLRSAFSSAPSNLPVTGLQAFVTIQKRTLDTYRRNR